MKKLTSTVFIGTLLLCTVIGFYYTQLPDNYYLSNEASGRFFGLETFFDVKVSPSEYHNQNNSRKNDALQVFKNAENSNCDYEVQLKLFGLFPIKTAQAEEIERPELVLGGTPFGIKILTDGAIVTELGMVEGEHGFSSPAREAGIKSGDVITKVNGIEISSNADVANAVQQKSNGEITQITFIRDDKERTVNITPKRSTQDGSYKIGMWVRDSSAGIGTLTFYNPNNSSFGGLGHAICDIDTGQIMPISSGQTVPVYISGVVKGYTGAPGELCGTFVSRVSVGEIKGNTESGIFGIMPDPPVNAFDCCENIDEKSNELQTIPMAYKQEVKVGPATIFTTIDGNTPKEYDIMIEKIDYNPQNQTKNMVVKITDRNLLKETGGIVQGMSGSPIVQNGKLVGAVTHVFVGDPTRGYAIFAENMYRKSQQFVPENNNDSTITIIDCNEYEGEYYFDEVA
ncbi:MAG: SpoIVB peptidase [Oscillospiraceae bacterium]|nr:SpoIVB peptidase [Oscillospiraceae bacterium]